MLEDSAATVTDSKQGQQVTQSGGVPTTSRISIGASTSKTSLPTPTLISQPSATAKRGSSRIPSGIPSAAPHKPHSTVGRTLSGPTAPAHKPHSTVGRTLSDPSEVPNTKQGTVSK